MLDRVSDLVWDEDPPQLREPIVVTAFKGWFDVGGAATGALEWLTARSESTKIAHIDPEEFFNFSEQRPLSQIEDGKRKIVWPDNEVHVLRSPDAKRDLVLVVGIEPQLRWRTFADSIVEVVERADAALLITLGAQISEIPHTRPFEVTGSTTDPELADALGLNLPSYQGITGIVGVLHDRFEQVDIPAVSLRVAVPHYVSGSPNPKGSRSLLERFERVTGLPTGWAELDDEAREWEERVNEAMVDDEDVIDYVKGLEEMVDTQTAEALPNADDIGAEFERFLRQQGEE